MAEPTMPKTPTETLTHLLLSLFYGGLGVIPFMFIGIFFRIPTETTWAVLWAPCSVVAAMMTVYTNWRR